MEELTISDSRISNSTSSKDNVNAYVLGPYGVLDAAEVHTLHNEDAVYTGKLYDHEANLLYFHHRYYDPETKRFISEDPAAIDITDPRTINRFTFVNNNPLRFVDPDGRISFEGLFRWAFKQDYGIEVEDSVEVAIKTAEELLPKVDLVVGAGPKAGVTLGPIEFQAGAATEINSNMNVQAKAFAKLTVNNIGPQASYAFNGHEVLNGNFKGTGSLQLLKETSRVGFELEKAMFGITVPIGSWSYIGLEFSYPKQ